MAWLFTEYDVAWNFQVLHCNFSIPRATSYSVNSQANVREHFNWAYPKIQMSIMVLQLGMVVAAEIW